MLEIWPCNALTGFRNFLQVTWKVLWLHKPIHCSLFKSYNHVYAGAILCCLLKIQTVYLGPFAHNNSNFGKSWLKNWENTQLESCLWIGNPFSSILSYSFRLLQMYWLILWVNLTQVIVIRDKGVSIEKMPPWDTAVKKKYFFSFSGHFWKAQPKVGDAISGMWFLVLQEGRMSGPGQISQKRFSYPGLNISSYLLETIMFQFLS